MNLTLRSWQARFLRELAAHRGDDFLLVACPAAGKTIAAAAGAAELMRQRESDQLVVVCPTVVVRDQWKAELERLGYRMLTDFRGSWPAHVHGVCATYAQVAHRADQYAAACERRRTVVVFDEIHHAGEQLSWGAAIATAFEAAVARLLLSGTPFRSDLDRIPFVRYGADGLCLADFSYDYARAVRDGVCRSIEFRAHDGLISWVEDGVTRTATFSERVEPEARARRLRAALDPSQPYLSSLLAAAHRDLQALRSRVPDAGGLVVCESQAHAFEVDRLLTEITGEVPTLAISDVPYAHRAIRAFGEEGVSWLVSVRMVAEGVDIPRLGVIAWATPSRTELMVRQVAGRAIRGRGDHAMLPAICHMPADPHLVKYAQRLDVLGGVAPRPRLRNDAGEEREYSYRARRELRTIKATLLEGAQSITPSIPAAPGHVHGAPEPIEISTPELPPAPGEVAAAEQARKTQRADVLRLLNVYAQLRRSLDPSFTLASAHAELVRAVGPVTAASPDEVVAAAHSWIHDATARLALENPKQLITLARTKRRIALAS